MASSLSAAELGNVRALFEQHALIYDTIGKTWAPTSLCLWSKDAQIPGKVTILSQYGDLKDFFVGILKVKIHDLGMLVDELSQVASSKLTVDDVKSLIWQINSFSPSRKALEKLKTLPIFPVKAASRGLDPAVLRVRNEKFSIIDRQPWADAFQGRIDFLDFNLEEVRKLQHFLSSFDFENYYLSRAIAETSSFQGEVREPKQQTDETAKNSQEFSAHSESVETVTVEVHKSKLHISEDSGVLKMYVPKDRKDQELCFLQLLPTKLFNEVMMGKKTNNSTVASDSEAVRIIAALFMSSDEVVCDLLDDADHSRVNREIELDAPPREDRGQRAEESASSPGSRLLSPTPPSCYRTNYRAATPTYRQPSTSSFISRPSAPQRNEPSPFSDNSGQAEYRRLLSNVIAAAKSQRGGFPTRGAFNLDNLLNALPIESDAEPVSYGLPFGVRSENQLAHDMKIGAVGELYAFEILSRLEAHIPGFDRGNWQSTIRRHVTVHEDYYGMDPWKGAETADITYDDTEGEFTKLLVGNEYLEDIWIGAKPKFYLEVKATTKECNTRFFVSKSQYQRMERMRLIAGEVSPEIYIILRVFNLGKDTIDMRLFVDPKRIEDGGSLTFTPESYSVLPAGSTNT
ncbi:uncharacterized protein BP5553_03065 [Venustampulla echinocandica]|uniref:Protein NO VEIN C-terminal domain-containing protein n=1 Tax=Venustampulla echinocandica TaxID=2656787 RepID=A0A370TT70_9HELO|nr:uncharacterized protein BP5553_03065 [Venustampulla echinocandica]RDL38725.1 hypothetical protein BP5553_03065 [Venustampulla echinocandica]